MAVMRRHILIFFAAAFCLCRGARDVDGEGDLRLNVETAPSRAAAVPVTSLISNLAVPGGDPDIAAQVVKHADDVALMRGMAEELMYYEPDVVAKGVPPEQAAGSAALVTPKVKEFLASHAHNKKSSFYYGPIKLFGADGSHGVYASILVSFDMAEIFESRYQKHLLKIEQSAADHLKHEEARSALEANVAKQRSRGFVRSPNPETQQWVFLLWDSFIADSVAFRDQNKPGTRSQNLLSWADFTQIFSMPGLLDHSDRMLQKMGGGVAQSLAPYITFAKKDAPNGGWAVKYHPVQPEIPVGRPATDTRVNEFYDLGDKSMVVDFDVYDGADPAGGVVMKIGYIIEGGAKRANIVPPYIHKCRTKEDLGLDQRQYNELVMQNMFPAHFHADQSLEHVA